MSNDTGDEFDADVQAVRGVLNLFVSKWNKSKNLMYNGERVVNIRVYGKIKELQEMLDR